MLESAIGEQVQSLGLGTRAELVEVAEGWRSWSERDDGWFAVMHGELVCRP
jgi:hypothetical protein